MSQSSVIAGHIIAAIIMFFVARWLNQLRETIPLLAFVLLGVAIIAACLAIAHWLDKRDEAQRER